jgi:hypothetical protein
MGRGSEKNSAQLVLNLVVGVMKGVYGVEPKVDGEEGDKDEDAGCAASERFTRSGEATDLTGEKVDPVRDMLAVEVSLGAAELLSAMLGVLEILLEKPINNSVEGGEGPVGGEVIGEAGMAHQSASGGVRDHQTDVEVTGGDELALTDSRGLWDGAIFVKVSEGVVNEDERPGYAVQVIKGRDHRANIPLPKEKGDAGWG